MKVWHLIGVSQIEIHPSIRSIHFDHLPVGDGTERTRHINDVIMTRFSGGVEYGGFNTSIVRT